MLEHSHWLASAVILRKIETYRRVLESYSRPLLQLIDWRPTTTGNVEVLNETADFYKYFDATEHAEFLYDWRSRDCGGRPSAGGEVLGIV